MYLVYDCNRFENGNISSLQCRLSFLKNYYVLCKSLLITVHGQYGELGSYTTVLACPSLKVSPGLDWWSDGHVIESCTNSTAIDSSCRIKCESPWVSYNPSKPHDSWKIECKGKNNPKWKNPSWSKRPDWACYHCPEQQILWKPRGKYPLIVLSM